MYLKIVLRIPIGIINYHSISSRQINTKTTGFGAQEEDKTVRIGLAKPINGGLTHVASNSTVNSFERVSDRICKDQ